MQWFLEAKQALEQGGAILCPTDTVWGLSGNALNEEVIQKVYNIKNRPQHKSFIVLMHSIEQLCEYVNDDVSDIEAFLEEQKRPTTVIYKQTKRLPAELLAADGSIAIRIPKEKWLIDFLQTLDFPLISTSANISGEVTPTVFEDVTKEIIAAVDYAVPYFPEATKQSSQIVKFEDGEVLWLRK